MSSPALIGSRCVFHLLIYMQKILLVLLLLPLCNTQAQIEPVESLIAINETTLKSLSEHKTAVISAELNLDESTARDFWKIYANYEAARLQLAVARFQLMAQYAQQRSSLDDNATDKLCKKWLKNDLAYVKLKKKYYRLFSKATSAAEASQFFRLENQLNISNDSRFHNSLLKG